MENVEKYEQYAHNPFNRELFDIKRAIPQRELREEMKHFTELHRFLAETVNSEYSRILGKEDMKWHL